MDDVGDSAGVMGDSEEKGRKEREQALAVHLAFLEHWRTELAYYEIAIQESSHSSRDFALAALRSGYLLNGGAIIALPAFLQIFKPTEPDAWFIGLAMILFIIGLIVCATSNYLAYLSANRAGQAYEHLRSLRGLDVRETYYPSQDRRTVAGTKARHTEASEKGFARTRTYVLLARVLYVTSLVCFVAGSAAAWMVWAKVDWTTIMLDTDTMLELVSLLVWPVAAIAIAVVLRGAASQLVSRLGGGGGARQESVPPEQGGATEAPTAEQQIRQPAAHINPVVERWTQVLRKQLADADQYLKNQGVDRETGLLRALATSNIHGHFERTYNMIWGSQIVVLQRLNAVVDLDEEELRPIYENTRALYPTVYASYPFENWLGFLQSNVLIERKGGRVSITPEGIEFLKYIIDRKYSLTKLA